MGGVATAAGGETGAGEGGGRGHTAGRGGCRGGVGPGRVPRGRIRERAGDRGEAMIEAGGKRREWGHSSGRSVPRGGRIPGD
jgi:hypothetical protein